jgi:ribosomal protein L32
VNPLSIIPASETSESQKRKRLSVPTFLTDFEADVEDIDFETVGHCGELLAAAEWCSACGMYDDASYPNVGGVHTILTRAPSIGFVLYFGVERDEWTAFTMSIACSEDWQGADYPANNAGYIDVNRNLELWIESPMAGGRIYVPWAYHDNQNVRAGRPIAARSYYTLDDVPVGDAPLVWNDGESTITVTVPASLTTFTSQVRLLTPGGRAFADFLMDVGAVG